MATTEAICFRLPITYYEKVLRRSEDRGEKIGSYMRGVMPFIVENPEVAEMNESLLSSINDLIKNRNVLESLEGKEVEKSVLWSEGFDFSVYTGLDVIGAFFPKLKIRVLDFVASEVKTDLFMIKRLKSNGSI